MSVVKRADLNGLTAAQRTKLVGLMRRYIDADVVDGHHAITHSNIEFFTQHRDYIADMEVFLAENGGREFVPLPAWNPVNPIPTEFNVINADAVSSREKQNFENSGRSMELQNLTIQGGGRDFTLPAKYTTSLCSHQDIHAFANDVSGWHGPVHGAIGGIMGTFDSPAAPIFWCWHAYVDDIYYDWQHCAASWQEIGTAANVTALTNMDGKLYCTTSDDRLLVSDANPANISWTDLGTAYAVTAMTALNGKLYAMTSWNSLWERETTSGARWRFCGGGKAVTGMSSYNNKLIFASSTNGLWHASRESDALPFLADWLDLDEAPDVEAMACVDGALFGVGNSRRLSIRRPLPGSTWTPIGAATDPSFVAITGIDGRTLNGITREATHLQSGHLYGVSTDGKLWMRSHV